MICSEYSRRGEEELYEGNGGHQRGWFGLKIRNRFGWFGLKIRNRFGWFGLKIRNRFGWFGLKETSSLSELAFYFNVLLLIILQGV
jgi:hypothetical protein